LILNITPIDTPVLEGIGRDRGGRRHPIRSASHVFEEGGEGGSPLGDEQHQGRFAPGRGAQPAARLVQVGVDGVLRDVEAARDLFGAQVLGDQSQAFAFARRQPFDA
jgi:hypothetical protein